MGANGKWISVEPLLGPLGKVNLREIDWAVIGGEPELGARTMAVAWAWDLRDQCRAAKLAIFVKQIGAIWADTKPPESHPNRTKGKRPVDPSSVIEVPT